ncbi:MAG: flagellar biosynthetic protein FliO [Gallionella sp.]|nr:flagellar biosynthetic protein FliO [Gallionella sp.]
MSRLRRAFNQCATSWHTTLLSSALCPLSFVYAAEVTRPAYTPPPPAVSSGNIAQIIFSLLLVLAAIVLVAWLLKRMNVAQQGSVKLLKVLGAVPIGQRERIVLVEIKDTWLVVGVGPGQIRTLHSLPKMEDSATDLQHTEAQSSGTKFSSLLSSVINHRKKKAIDK